MHNEKPIPLYKEGLVWRDMVHSKFTCSWFCRMIHAWGCIRQDGWSPQRWITWLYQGKHYKSHISKVFVPLWRDTNPTTPSDLHIAVITSPKSLKRFSSWETYSHPCRRNSLAHCGWWSTPDGGWMWMDDLQNPVQSKVNTIRVRSPVQPLSPRRFDLRIAHEAKCLNDIQWKKNAFRK